jgi:hypothetical protein
VISLIWIAHIVGMSCDRSAVADTTILGQLGSRKSRYEDGFLISLLTAVTIIPSAALPMSSDCNLFAIKNVYYLCITRHDRMLK